MSLKPDRHSNRIEKRLLNASMHRARYAIILLPKSIVVGSIQSFVNKNLIYLLLIYVELYRYISLPCNFFSVYYLLLMVMMMMKAVF